MPSSIPAEPADVIRSVAAGVSRLVAGNLTPSEREAQLDQLAELYAEQTDVRHPFAPLGDRPLRSRAELRDHFAQAGAQTGRAERFEPVDTIVHTTHDPEVVVVEFAYAVAARDRDARLPCIFVVRVRDGQIVESRDYADHVAAARAFGRLESLAGALLAPADRPATTEETGRDLVQRVHAAFNTRAFDAVDEIFAADFYSHSLQTRGPEAVKTRWRAIHSATPDLRTEVLDVLADGDRAVVRSRLLGHTGELFELVRIEAGRIAELWGARTDGPGVATSHPHEDAP